ncbi:copper chaperone PCu(A)C [uncultured Corynebacterium sp.]|uniref:copper chaperone PCu(A)C n=1 Tax=uncultured Corynebacterium sp. TaxID=159447 RepID=UPI0025D6B170|nr:copper chaperone PCu(A)C [uncultured Corynebacterium sp.]
MRTSTFGRNRLAALSIATVAAASLALASCSAPGEKDGNSEAAHSSVTEGSNAAKAPSSSASTSAAHESGMNHDGHDQMAGGKTIESGDLAFQDAYITAKPASKKMTGVFGTFKNNSDKEITITEVSGSLKGRYEIHETNNGVMSQMKGGLKIGAGQTSELKPGGNHLMIMDNTDEFAAGDTLTLNLKDSEGKTYELKDIPVRVQNSQHEHYGK